MDDSLFAPQDVADTYQNLLQIYATGKYRDVWDAAITAWGEPRMWRAPEQLILGGRLASQLGLQRTADAFFLWAARRHGDHPLVRYFYSRFIFGRKGPLAALEYMRPIGETLADNAKWQSDWLLLFAEIHISYRDWDSAQDYIDRATSVCASNTWINIVTAELLECRDDYAGALFAVETLAKSSAPYRSAVQSAAHLYVLSGREDDAIALLASAGSHMQCVGIFLQLQDLHRERGEHVVAARYLSEARACVPEGKWKVDSRLTYAEFEQSYEQGEFDSALATLKKMRFGFTESVAQNMEKNGASARRAKLNVPFIRQHHMTCAPATFTAIAKYWGHHFDHLDVAEKICYDGTPATTERTWIAELGWRVYEFELQLDTICELIDRGVPVGVSTVEPGNAHMQAISGYDLFRGVYLLRDPFVRHTRELLIEGAHKYYQSTGPRCMVCLPPDKEQLLHGLELPAAHLYDLYYEIQKALENNRRDDAVQKARELSEVAPTHRLAVWSRRSIAAYDRDLNRLLQTTEELIERYPKDLNLLASKASLLGDLGREKEKIAFLESRIDDECRHPYLLQALVDEIRFDNRRDKETLPFLDEILRQRPRDARALFAKAYVLWNTQEFDRAFELYRFAACLEDKHEGFAESYFKAGRILGRRDEALAFLKNREERLGALSGDPSVTLARVYSLLDLDLNALSVIKSALQRHPDNAWLINEALDLYVFLREFDDAKNLLTASESVLTKANYLERAARLASSQEDDALSRDYYQKLLNVDPYHAGAINALVRHVQDQKGPSDALEALQRYLNENPNNYVLRGIQIDLISELSGEQRRTKIAELVTRFPGDIRVLLEAARAACVDRDYIEAQKHTDSALMINRKEVDAMILNGFIAFQCREYQLAISRFKEIISYDVDVDGVFYRLLDCYSGYRGKREALAFIHEQLLKQVTLGNGLIDFLDIAPRYLPIDDVRELLELACEQRPDLWQSWACMAEFWDQRGDHQKAIEYIDVGIARFPLIPRMWFVRSRAHQASGDLLAAISDLQEALQLNPRWITAITSLADAFEALTRFDEADAVIDDALLYMPAHSTLLVYKADSEWRRGKKDAAIGIIEKALHQSPSYDWAWRQLRAWRIARNEAEKVLQFAEQLANENKTSASLWSRCHDECGDAARRLEFIRKAIELQPHNPDYLIDECNLLLDMGALQTVREKLDASNWKGDRPSNIVSYEAWLYWRLGERETAIKKMQALVKFDPAFLVAWRYLSEWYREQEMFDEGVESARRCVELRPRDASVLAETSKYLLSVNWADKEKQKSFEDEAKGYLERALALDPTSNVLQVRLLDAYIESSDFDEAGKLLGTYGVSVTNPFVLARKMHCLLQSENTIDAMMVYQSMLTSSECNKWVAERGVVLSASYECIDEVEKIIDTVVQKEEGVAEVGFAWARLQCEKELPATRLLKALHEFRAHPKYWVLAVQSFIKSDQLGGSEKASIYSRYQKRFVEESDLRSCAMWMMADKQEWAPVKRLGKQIEPLPNNEMSSLYLYNFALRLDCKWSRAAEVTRKALRCDPDGTFCNVMLWRDMDVAIEGALNDYSLVEVDVNELSSLERFVYEYLVQIKAMREIPLHQNLLRYQKEFSRIKRAYRKFYMESHVVKLRSALRGAAVRTIPGGFWFKMFWHFRLLSVV